MNVQLLCYRTAYAELEDVTLAEAQRVSEQHIRTGCPHGPMPWATAVEWHHLDAEIYDLWVSAARGEWIDHHIRGIGWEDRQTPYGPPKVS